MYHLYERVDICECSSSTSIHQALFRVESGDEAKLAPFWSKSTFWKSSVWFLGGSCKTTEQYWASFYACRDDIVILARSVTHLQTFTQTLFFPTIVIDIGTYNLNSVSYYIVHRRQTHNTYRLQGYHWKIVIPLRYSITMNLRNNKINKINKYNIFARLSTC